MARMVSRLHRRGRDCISIIEVAFKTGFTLADEKIKTRKFQGVHHSRDGNCFPLKREERASTEKSEDALVSLLDLLENPALTCETCVYSLEYKGVPLHEHAEVLEVILWAKNVLYREVIPMQDLSDIHYYLNSALKLGQNARVGKEIEDFGLQDARRAQELYLYHQPTSQELESYHQTLLRSSLNLPTVNGTGFWEKELQHSFDLWLKGFQSEIDGKMILAVLAKGRVLTSLDVDMDLFNRIYRIKGKVYLFPSSLAPWASRNDFKEHLVLDERPSAATLEALAVLYDQNSYGTYGNLKTAYEAAKVL